MSKDLLNRLKAYQDTNGLKGYELAKKLGVPENYIYRWRKAAKITGIYYKVIDEFLKKEGF